MSLQADSRAGEGTASSPLASLLSLDETVEVVSERIEALSLSPRRPAKLRPTWTRFKRPKDWLEGMPRVGFVYDEVMLSHNKPGHIERPGRTLVPFQRLKREGTLPRCFQLESRAARTSELMLFHSKEHLSNVEQGNLGIGDDLYWLQDTTLKSAVFSAGCTLQAMEAVLHGSLDNAFALVRPPGHHADPCCSQGFCFFNNVGIAAVKALSYPSLCRRVLILDWDAHHGNGTQDAFYQDPNVLYISLHRGGVFYPGTGEIAEIGYGNGYGFNMNIPWPRGGFGDADYLAAFESVVEPLIAAFKPDITLVSAGFDSAMYDPLGDLCVTPDGFAHMTQRLMRLNAKIVLVLEGGYNLLQVSACVDQCMQTLLGGEPRALAKNMKMQSETEDILRTISKNLSLVWPVLKEDKFEARMERYKAKTLGR